MRRNPKDKGYLSLATSKGTLNIELRCDLAPRTCENFLVLCEMGYYNGTAFHRSIRNFMLQGGDPTGTGTGGESIYGPTFPDEMDSRLLHSGRGVLAMANSGKNTNASQFYILYKSAAHLDFKHSVFGAVVGGLEVLSAIEDVPTDEDDRPTQRITITGARFASSHLSSQEHDAGFVCR
jgi:peptidyl-prolyl cis-trans isomerase-like 2